MIRSMTGFARVRESLPDGELVLTIKAVNHRGLDLHFYSPPEFDAFEQTLRSLVKQQVARGHLDVRISRTRSRAAGAPGWNRALMENYLAAFREACELYGLAGQPDLNAAFRIPGMLQESPDEEAPPEVGGFLAKLMEQALRALNEFREREGAELAAAIEGHVRSIQAAAVRMEEIRRGAVEHFQARLNERLSVLLGAAGMEPQRLAQEAAILADRSDIGEEIARLRIHAGELHEILAKGGEVGKKLDFLLQEMSRETNTILSKTSGAGEVGLELTGIALGVKSEIEKIREQALNLE